MIFRQEMVDKILAGEKTVTRRPVRLGYTHGAVQPKRIELPCRYKIGKTYAIQPGRGQKAVGRLRVVRRNREMLGTIDDTEARLEGFEDRYDFVRYWEGLYGHFKSTQLVNRIEFELVEVEE